jgi:tRNA A37 threonylcarbamoyladenosine synthetase subunit TsaC/SUA5/YrdC
MEKLLESFGIDYKILIAQIINFSLIFFLLYKFLFNPLKKVIEERKKKIYEGLKKWQESEKLIRRVKKFNVRLNSWQRKILEKLWPGKISVVLSPRINSDTTLINADNKNNKSNRYQRSSVLNQRSSMEYLHRGTNSLSFRLPKDKLILNILKISGPIIAPSANWESYEPAKNIREAKRYFGNKVFYLDRGNLISKPSTLIDLREKKIKILREGEEIRKVFEILKHLQ